MRVCGARGGPEAGASDRIQALTLRELLLPFLPNAVFPDGQLAIIRESRATLPLDGAVPFRLKRGGLAGRFLLDDSAQDIEVVYFAQNILKLLEVGAPRFILLWQQAFHRVAEFLQTNAKRVPGARLVGSQRLGMQLLRFAKALHRQALRRRASRRHQPRPLPELSLQALPTLLVKFPGQPKRLLHQFRLFFLKECVQGDAQFVVLRAMFGDPLIHDLGVAQFAELAEELFGETTQLMPGGIGVDLSHDRANRSAAPNGYAQIVHRVFVRGVAEVVELPQDAIHPMGKTAMLGGSNGKRSNGSHACL